MLIHALRAFPLTTVVMIVLGFSVGAQAQNYFAYPTYGYRPVAPVAVVPYYRMPTPVPFVAARVPVPFVAAPYPIAPVTAVAPVAYYTARPVLSRPVVARTKYYVPFQPIRNTVRAVTP